MFSSTTIVHKRLRSERSAELATVCDITGNSLTIELYDLAMSRVYARTALFGERLSAMTAAETLSRLLVTAMREHNIPASAVNSVGIAADVHIAEYLEQTLELPDLYLRPDAELYFPPYISAGLGGRFTASLLTIPDEDFLCADLGNALCIAKRKKGELCCASFSFSGAFDGSGLESGMPAERGAIDAVRRENDKTLAYEVIEDAEGLGVSPCGAAAAVLVMIGEGIIDANGIMFDRDYFHIGEDIFISQKDIRVIQADKAKSAAAFELFRRESRVFLSGEVFSNPSGLKTLIALGALPDDVLNAAFAKNSALRGVENCLKDEKTREKAAEIAKNARDITESLMDEFDEKYIEHIMF